jgi:hypothetical protein
VLVALAGRLVIRGHPSPYTCRLLPPGLHPATIQEVEERFGQHTARRTQLFAKLDEFLKLVRSFRLFTSLFVDGSFVTDKAEPGDIDAVLVLPRAELPRLLQHARLAKIVDSVHIKRTFEVDLFVQPSSQGMVDFFQSLRPDEAIRRGVPPTVRRGILEVAL